MLRALPFVLFAVATAVPLPVLGHLFKTTTKVNNKAELLIFVTPKILREGVSVN